MSIRDILEVLVHNSEGQLSNDKERERNKALSEINAYYRQELIKALPPRYADTANNRYGYENCRVMMLRAIEDLFRDTVNEKKVSKRKSLTYSRAKELSTYSIASR